MSAPRRSAKKAASTTSNASPSTSRKKQASSPVSDEVVPEEELVVQKKPLVVNDENDFERAKEDYYTAKGRFKDEKDRQQWALNMRLKFTVKEMLNEDGTINHNWFKPKTTTIKVKKWTGRERELLIKGIEKHGISNWNAIKTESLPEWDEQDLRIKTMRLMGRQNLQRYKGWKGDEAAIQKEYEKNMAIGTRLNCWKGGVLVADDGGLVEQALKEADANLISS